MSDQQGFQFPYGTELRARGGVTLLQRVALGVDLLIGEHHRSAPAAGDGFLHCGHAGAGTPCKVFHADGARGIRFRRPDGSVGTVRWLLTCKPCLFEAGLPSQLAIGGDGMFYGDGSADVRTFDPAGLVRRMK